jgi:hypothetical protein
VRAPAYGRARDFDTHRASGGSRLQKRSPSVTTAGSAPVLNSRRGRAGYEPPREMTQMEGKTAARLLVIETGPGVLPLPR